MKWKLTAVKTWERNEYIDKKQGMKKKTEDRDKETEQKEKYQETRWAIFNAYVKEGFRFERWKWGEE